MRRGLYLTIGAAAVACVAAALASPGSATQRRAAISMGCTKATNIEAIIDDSGSMAFTDLDKLRVKGLKLLIQTLPGQTVMGAVEFGGSFDPSVPSADTVFSPKAVGPNASAMSHALDQKINADNGVTDYNAAFSKSDADNPNANARIFLTDGGHNVGTYANGHLTHNVPTYVIGFSTGVAASEDKARLKKIADDTGGKFYALNDSSQLQSVMNSIGAALLCQTPPKSFTDQLKQGATKQHAAPVAASTRSLNIALTWSSPNNRFTVGSLRIVRGGKVVAIGRAPAISAGPRRLKVKLVRSSTFVVAKVSRVVRGTIKFKVKASRISTGATAKLTTQVTQSKR